ncbi:MAG: hypothetical protein KTR15_09775 [Phycisphaeraceae bacterium]|nr:hypothetical protein [Phycisphaeraceae bacterium]
MTRPLNLTVLLAALMLLVSPALAQKKQAEQAAPPKAIGETTMLAVYVDVTQLDPEMISGVGDMLLGLAENEALQDQELALPIGDPQQLADMLTLLRGSFVQAGGEALMMTIEMPEEDSWSPPMALLAKTNDKFDATSMTALIRSMGEAKMEASIEALGDGWQNIAMKSKEGDAVTLPLPKPDAAAFDAINKQLTQHKKPMLAVAFRMQDQLREMMDQAEQAAKNAQPGQGQDAQQQMAMGMMMGMFKPVRSLDTLGLAISQVDEGMLVDAQMTFQDAQSAQQFANLYNSILMFAPVMMAGAAQEGQIENMPDPATINQFFMKLRMTVAGNSLKLTLDQDFFDLAEKLAPLFEGLNGQGEEDFDL